MFIRQKMNGSPYILITFALVINDIMDSTLLLIDDEPIIRKLLSRMMELEGYEVHAAEDCASGMKALRRFKPSVVLCDVFLPDGNGVDMVKDMKAAQPGVEVILLTAHGNISDGVQAIKNGAFDYIVKGDDNKKIIPIVSRAIQHVKANGGHKLKKSSFSFSSILGKSACLQTAITLAHKVADTDVAVLLTGETGTGKELFAQAIHGASRRSKNPFIAINCSAFSKDLLESELFGHRAGAFTGASGDKKGLFEAADKGTLFLDEIGEMDFGLQSKLLRVLETGEYIKIGDTTPTHVDVRIISATNRDLKEEIVNDRFRSDLYYRLSVFHIPLPPLRNRREDILPLAEYFLNTISAKLNKQIDGMDDDFVEALKKAEWRGNIRELKNVMERSVIVCDRRLVFQDLPLELQDQSFTDNTDADHNSMDMDLATIEHRHIARVLQYTNGNKTEASRLLKIGLTTLYRKIEEYNIK